MTNADGAAPEASSLLPQALAGIAGGLIFSLGVLFSATKSTRFPAKLLRLIGGTGLLLAVIFLGYSFGGLGRAFSKLAAAETVDVVEFSDLLEAMSFPTVMGIGLFFLASVSLGVSRLFLESEMKRHRFAGLAAIAFGAALTLAMIWLSYSAMGYESTLSKGAGIQPAGIQPVGLRSRTRR